MSRPLTGADFDIDYVPTAAVSGYVTVPPGWLDPAEATPSFTSPYWVLYALHDAVVKPMPGQRMAPSSSSMVARARGIRVALWSAWPALDNAHTWAAALCCPSNSMI